VGRKTSVLLLDGHSSHYTLDLTDYAQENNIILLRYLTHCTHALQGLDVVCFAKMKEAWKQEIVSFKEEKTYLPLELCIPVHIHSRHNLGCISCHRCAPLHM